MAYPSQLPILNLELLSNSTRGSRMSGMGSGFRTLECSSNSLHSSEPLLHFKERHSHLQVQRSNQEDKCADSWWRRGAQPQDWQLGEDLAKEFFFKSDQKSASFIKHTTLESSVSPSKRSSQNKDASGGRQPTQTIMGQYLHTKNTTPIFHI